MSCENSRPALVVSSAWNSGLARSSSMRVRPALAVSEGNRPLRAMRTSSCALPSRSRLACSDGLASMAARMASSRVNGRASPESAYSCSASARNCQRGEKPIWRAVCMLMTRRCEVGKLTSKVAGSSPAAMRWTMSTTRRASRSVSRSAPPVVISRPASTSLRPSTENEGSLRALSPATTLCICDSL